MKKLSLLVCLAVVSINLSAQSDSTFISIYPLASGGLDFWSMDHGYEQAANVFEAWDGNFVLQSSIIVDTDPPPGLGLWTYYSPFVVFNRNGQYLSISSNTDSSYDILKYRRVIKAEPGYYLGAGTTYYYETPKIIRMDASFNGISEVIPILNNGLRIWPKDIVDADDGYIITGTATPDTLIYNVVAKFGFNGNEIWHRTHVGYGLGRHYLQKLSDGSFLSVNGNKLLRVSATGDSLACVELLDVYPDQVLELNNHFYAINYFNPNVLWFYDLGMNLAITSPSLHHDLQINHMDYYPNNQGFSVVSTTDGGYIMLAATLTGEVAKYDSTHICEWRANLITNEVVGSGRHNIIELANGDFLYCTGVGYLLNLNAFTLVRITAEGVPVSDFQEPSPSVPSLTVSPNPFPTAVNVEITGKTAKNSQLKVYNLKGQLLETLSITNSKASWQPQNQASGIYLIQLEQDGIILNARKITYLRTN